MSRLEIVAFHSAGAAGFCGFMPGCLGGSCGLPGGETGGLLGDPIGGLLAGSLGGVCGGLLGGKYNGFLGGLTSLPKGSLGFGRYGGCGLTDALFPVSAGGGCFLFWASISLMTFSL